MTKHLQKQSLAAIPSGHLSSSVLKRTGPTGKGSDFILDRWRRLQKDEPATAQFIATVSYQMAPDDPEAREQLSNAMIRLHILITEAALQDAVSASFAKSFEELALKDKRA